MPHLSRLWKPLIGCAAIFAAFTVTFVWPQRNGLDIDIDGSPRAQAARNREPYDLTQLQVLNRVILHVKDQYVEPERVVPKRMLLSGLNAIQRSVAPVLVNYVEGRPSLTVQVKNEKKQFKVEDVTSPWALAFRFREIFAFLQKNLTDEDVKFRDIEYAAINGMLRTLDPHSVLLTPDVFEEMRMSTRGEFGGLGIVISIRDGQLTVIKPMPGTPATRAGLHRGDQIVKIDEESTLNLPLQEAVNRLRGAPNSKVAVWVVRPGQGGFSTPRRFELTRAIIHIPSVESRMLADGIGYVSIKSFQGNTYEDMRSALNELHRQAQGGKNASSGSKSEDDDKLRGARKGPTALRGLVLDLRDNPGGLLDQAVKVADAFLSSGTIVTTSSNDPSQRDEKFARPEGTEPSYPMIVLVNGGSASASEIVAGALKNHDRALIVGQRTFGKGSVQVLYDFPEDGSALKLTIAQYLTPGDVSIQGVGIVPDVGIDPMTVDAEDMDLAVDQNYLREADLRRHLTHKRARETATPPVVLRYYLPKETRSRLREAGPEDLEENEREDEFLTRFSRDLLAKATRSGRREMLNDAQPVIGQTRQTEMTRATAELKKLGVNWNVGADAGASDVAVEVGTNQPKNEVTAGETFELKVKVTNKGAKPLYQLRASTKSDFRLFDGRELVFGQLNPGETRQWSTTLGICDMRGSKDKSANRSDKKPRSRDEGQRSCVLPKDITDRADGIKVEFFEAHGHAPKAAELRTVVRSLPRPQFAYQIQVADNGRGNGDGHVQKGEVAKVYLKVKNVGQGRTYETQANLSSLSGRGVLLKDGRFRIDNMAPGEERSVAFSFEVLPDFDKNEAKLEVSVTDTDLREAINEKLIVPIAAAGGKDPRVTRGRVVLKEGALVWSGPSSKSKAVAKVVKGNLGVVSEAELADFLRIDLGGGRPGWVAKPDVVNGKASGSAALAYDVNHMPPHLDLDHGNTLVTRQPVLKLKGRAKDERVVRDVYVFVGAQKVFYQANRNDQNPREATFATQVPLHGGTNYVTVVARESNDTVSRRTFVVRRDAESGALLETPRFDEEEMGQDLDPESLPGGD